MPVTKCNSETEIDSLWRSSNNPKSSQESPLTSSTDAGGITGKHMQRTPKPEPPEAPSTREETTICKPAMESFKPQGQEHLSRSRIMVITSDRVLYVGQLGQPTVRTLGAVTIYTSLGSPFFVRTDDGHWNSHEYAMLLPYVSHQVTTVDKLIGVILIEPETVDLERLCDSYGQPETSSKLSAVAYRVRDIHDDCEKGGSVSICDNQTFDMKIFGTALEPRPLDPRIETIIRRISKYPQDQWLAEQCAESVSLSFSRFLHLFKQEMTVPFRVFVAWKRARSLLGYVTHRANLTDIALEIGYPDATHFSHSIRKAYGLKPKDIFAGSRSLVLYR